jgi:hypothetical protein
MGLDILLVVSMAIGHVGLITMLFALIWKFPTLFPISVLLMVLSYGFLTGLALCGAFGL